MSELSLLLWVLALVATPFVLILLWGLFLLVLRVACELTILVVKPVAWLLKTLFWS